MSGNPRFNRLGLDDLGGNDAIVCTISRARIQSFSKDYLDTSNQRVVLNFKEFGDKDYVLNVTSYTALSERYGRGVTNNFAEWLDQPCVLIKADTEYNGNAVEAVWVARGKDWDECMTAYRAQVVGERGVKRTRRKAGK